MKRKQHTFVTWRLKLILVLGGVGGLAVGLFGQYVASMSDLPLGPTPLSWKFKSNSAQVASAFDTGGAMAKQDPLTGLKLPAIDQAVSEETAFALFALGWFWSVDSRFGSLPGVLRTAVGYTGGLSETPNYYKIGDHSEAIRIEFDPQQLSYEQLLAVFWESHDPGYDAFSRQYRNAVFYMNEKQGKAAKDSRQSVADGARGEIFTSIVPAGEFFVAEDYHQKYLLRKATGILQEFQAMYPDEPSLTASTAATRINGYLGCNGEPAILEKELALLGLSQQMQARLAEHVASSCEQFAGLTCPSRN